MTRWHLVFLGLAVSAPLVAIHAQILDDRLQPPGSIADGAMTLRATQRALRRSAERDAEHGKVSRIALFEMAFPDDSAEFAALGGNALLAITALSWCQYELPLKSAYLATDSGRAPLELVSSIYSAEADSTIAAVYGKHRIDQLFLVPVEGAARGGVLAVDFAEPPGKLPQAAARVCGTKGRDAFELHRFESGEIPEEYLKSVAPLVAHSPNVDSLVAFVRRQYPEFLAPPDRR
jgi:hypothetical protein